ncbi:MAG TPA: VOC family protein [Anaerolineales bacterium]|nr:VOC family protein [Anaerolineales bacterium]
MNSLDSTAVVQIGIIVKDIEQKAGAYARVFGIPVPAIVPIAGDAFANTRYRGEPSQAQGKGAFFNLGPVEMELIEPVGAPSTWEEFLRTHGEGIHHIAFKTQDMDAARGFLAAQGLETIQQGGWDGGQYAYVDGSSQLGLILELLHFDK